MKRGRTGTAHEESGSVRPLSALLLGRNNAGKGGEVVTKKRGA